MTVYTIERPGRPMTMNRYRTLHYRVWGEHNRTVRGEWKLLTKAAKVPALDAITVTAQPLIKGGQVADCGACAPDVKAAIDGVRDAGVIVDDTPRYLRSITFLPPLKAGRDALQLVITEVSA